MRASDAEREATAKVLRRHYAEGRLDHGEYEERIDRCYAAKRVGQLDELTFDLPRDDAAQEPESHHPQRDDRPAWREGTAARLRAAIVARMRRLSPRRRVAAGIMGMALLFGTLGGAIAIEGHALPFPGIERADGETANGPDAQDNGEAEGRDDAPAPTVTQP